MMLNCNWANNGGGPPDIYTNLELACICSLTQIAFSSNFQPVLTSERDSVFLRVIQQLLFVIEGD